MTSAALLLIAAVAQVPVAGPAGVVSGHVLHADTRAPLAEAVVTLLPPLDRLRLDPSAFRPLSVTTDTNGRFFLEAVPAGRYEVRARKAGFADGSGRGARPVAIAAGGRVDDLELLLEPSGVIVGRVVDARGMPVDRALVVALRGPRPGALPSPGSGLAGARGAGALAAIRAGERTNARGEFAIDEIPAGEYYLRAGPPIAPGDAGQSGGGSRTLVGTYYPGTQDPADAVAVSVAAGLPVDVGDLVMLAVEGFRIAGRVVDESGRGVPDVMIRLVPSSAPVVSLPMTMTRTETDGDGAFALDRVVAGDYALIAVPGLVLRHDSGPFAGPNSAFESFVIGGTRSESARGSVWTESRNGVTRQYRDELGTRQRVIVEADVPNLHVVVRPVAVP